MKKRTIATAVAALLLSACQQPLRHCTTSGAAQNAQKVETIRVQQYQLWNASMMNTQTTLPEDSIRTNSTRVSLDWDGDATELLAQLARQRGLEFNYSGVRLPLPLNIHVRNITFQNLMRIIDSQTAWRATTHQYPGLLQLEFMRMPVLIAAHRGQR